MKAAEHPTDAFSYQERRLGRTVLRTYRTTVDLEEVVPNDQQPRLGPKEDVELQRQIEANEGVFEPLLLEPHPTLQGKFRIIDGDRRWSNTKVLVEQGREALRTLPAEITDRVLTDDERLRVWIYIHRQRKEWDAKEKEMVAYRLVDLVGRASAANILGVTVPALDKLVEIYELSERLRGVKEPGASITWAREIRNLNRKLLTSTVLDTIVRKVNHQEITNSKDVRKLRQILRDPVGKDEFLSGTGTVESAFAKVEPLPAPRGKGLAGDVRSLLEAVRSRSWIELDDARGDPELLKQISEVERTFAALRRQLESATDKEEVGRGKGT